MTQKAVRVRVRCRRCTKVACLPPENYQALVKQPQRRFGSPQEFDRRLAALESTLSAAAPGG